MGPCKGGTLDRKDPSDPEYAPGKVRWADKRTQSANRRNVNLIQTPEGPKTVAQIAKLQKVAEFTIRMRLTNKWTYMTDIWAGRRSARTPTSPAPASTLIPPIVEDDKAPSFFLPKPDLKPVWEKAMSEAFPGEFHELTPWVKKELGDFELRCVANYLTAYTEDLLAHTIKNWPRFTENAKDRDGAFGNIPTRPNMAFLLKFFSASVNLYLSDNHLAFIGTRIQSKAPLPTKPSQKLSEPHSAPPAPAKPYIEVNVNEDDWVERCTDQIDEHQPEHKSPERRSETLEEFLAIWNEDEDGRSPIAPIKPELCPMTDEEAIAWEESYFSRLRAEDQRRRANAECEQSTERPGGDAR